MGSLRVIEGGGARPLDMGVATYIWLNREGEVCSRTKVISLAQTPEGEKIPMLDRWKMLDRVEIKPEPENPIGDWQERHEPKLTSKTFILSPCYYVPDPLRPQPSYLVLCEVRTLEDNPVEWNTRARVRKYTEGEALLPWWGIRQQFPKVSTVKAGIEMKERFLLACIDAGIRIHSADYNFYWVGPRNISDAIDVEEPSSLVIGDHLILARAIFERLMAEQGDVYKPANISAHGALHLSTAETRAEPEKVGDLTLQLDSLRFSPDWKPRITEGLDIKSRAANYVKLSGMPNNLDPYEVMHHILTVLVNHQTKPFENPDTTEG